MLLNHHLLFAQHTVLQTNVLATVLPPFHTFPFAARFSVQVSNYKYYFFLTISLSLKR